MKQSQINKNIVLKTELVKLVIKKNILKKKLQQKKFGIKKISKNSYKNNPKHLNWMKGQIFYIKRRCFGHWGWRIRRFIKKPLKRKKFKRFKKLNWLFKNNINIIFFKSAKPIITKVIKFKKELCLYKDKNNDIKISKNFKLYNYI